MNTSPALAKRTLVSSTVLALTLLWFAHDSYANPPVDNSLVANLRLTEVGPTYRELTNVGFQPVDLSTLIVQETAFPIPTLLPPGQSVVLAPNAAAFTQTYGAGKPVFELQPVGFDYANPSSAFSLRVSGEPEPFFQFQPGGTPSLFGPGSQWEVNDPTGNTASFHSVENWRPVLPSPGTYLPFLLTAIDSFDMPTLNSAWNAGDWKLNNDHRRRYSLTAIPGSLMFHLTQATTEISGMERPWLDSLCGVETRVACNGTPAGTFAGVALRTHSDTNYHFPNYHLFGIANGSTLRVQAPDSSILFERPLSSAFAKIRIVRSGGYLCFEVNENDAWQRVLTVNAPPNWDGASLFATGPADTQVSFAYASFYKLGTHTVRLKDSLAISEMGNYYHEITNIGRKTLLLDDLSIVGDVGKWKVTPGSFLQPGCSAVITHDVQAHRGQFGEGHQVIELIGENFPGVSDTHWYSAGGDSLFQTYSGKWIAVIGGDWTKTGQPVDLHNPSGPWEGAAPSPGVYKGNRNLGGSLVLTEVASDFMELTNVSGKTFYLDSLVISGGGQSSGIPANTLLEPLHSVILVQDLAAFRLKYGPALRAIAVPEGFPLDAETLTFSTVSEGNWFTWERQLFTSAINGDLTQSVERQDFGRADADWIVGIPSPGMLRGILSTDLVRNLKLTEVGTYFIEVTNFGSETLLLDGLNVVGETSPWSIPTGIVLAPDCSIILVHDVAAFHQKWGASIPAAPLTGANPYPYYDDNFTVNTGGKTIARYGPYGFDPYSTGYSTTSLQLDDPLDTQRYPSWSERPATPGIYVQRQFLRVHPLDESVPTLDTIEGANIWFSAAENFYSTLKPVDALWSFQGPETVSVSHDWPNDYGVQDKRLARAIFPKAGVYDVSFSASIPQFDQEFTLAKQVTIARPDDLDPFFAPQLRGYWKVYNANNASQPQDEDASYSVTRVSGKLDMDTLRPLPFPRAEIGTYCAPRIMRPLPGPNCLIQVNISARYGHFAGLYACSRGYSGAQYAFGWEGSSVVVYRSYSPTSSTAEEVFRQAAPGQGLRIQATDAGLLFQIRDTGYGGTGAWTTVWTDPGETSLSEAGPAVASANYNYWGGGTFDDVLVIDVSTLPQNLKLTGVGPDFYELSNVGNTALDLTHLKFATSASILTHAPLAPGKSILIVENAAQFLQGHSTTAAIVEVPGLIASSRQANLLSITAPGRLQPFLTFTPSTFGAAQDSSFEVINLAESIHYSWNWRQTSKDPGAWAQDLDGDSVPDSTEIRFGTNPNDPASRHYLNAARDGSGKLVLEWPTANGQTYVVEYCETLGELWRPLATLTGQGSALTFMDPTTPQPPRRFYRISAP